MATEKLKIGSKAPNFELLGIDDKHHSLESFSSKKLLCIIFSCNHCPYVKAYEGRMIDIQMDFEKDLFIVAINSNDEINYPEDSFVDMKKRASKLGFNFAYLRDADQKIASAFGATHTPEIFLFDENRTLQFHGKIDDNWEYPNKIKEPYLKNAINELLNGKEVSTKETFTIGCTIKWKY
ncbi:MAG: thioredoxin family protein [Ignavibacteria bacterium]|nr:thioredoxin family protein [Ignavibacteria bacterium]